MPENDVLMNEDVRVLFRNVAGLAATEREDQYVRRRVSARLREEVESLLSFDNRPHDTLINLVGSAAEQFLLSNAPVSDGGLCGPYRLLRLLGNGGMGAVYLAERADGEIVQRVAVKFVRTGVNHPSLRERFLRERQILASLNHPGIARLLDVGHNEEHPYLAMEYVDGARIDAYAAGLDSREILTLFLQVADAVSYAHRNLIIHRDLKPSNILVDVSGQPKLLDFGIARLLDATEETRTVDRVMTPEYASPEQMRGEAQATTTDVYSLGAVLYKLLTGQNPKTPEGTGPMDGLPKDLGAIIGRAMREEPSARYASVDLFSADIQAYLDHRPVQARRGKAWYLARKFTRRHWLPISAGALAIAGLATGLVIANRERVIAERRFELVRQLSSELLDLDEDVRVLPGAIKARQRIVSASLGYLQRLGAEAGGSGATALTRDSDLSLDMAKAYLRVARVQGVPGQSTLGQFAHAKESLVKAESFVEPIQAQGSSPRQRSALLLSAEISHDMMILAQTQTHNVEALELTLKASSRLEAFEQMGEPAPQEALVVAQLYVNIALTHQNLHRLDDAARYARRSVEMSRHLDDGRRPLSRSLSVLANTTRYAGDFETSLRSIQEARSIAEKLAEERPGEVERVLMLCASLWREGLILGEYDNINVGREREALPLLRRAFDLADGLAQRNPQDYTSRSYVSMTGRELADILRGVAKPAEALAIYDHVHRRLDEVKHNPKARRTQVEEMAGASYALRQLGRPAESQRRLDEAFASLRELKVYPADQVLLGEEIDAALRARGDHYADTGQVAKAIGTYEELRARVQASKPQPQTDLRHAHGLSRIYQRLETLYQRVGRSTEAAALHQLRLDLWGHWDGKLPGNPFIKRQLAAVVAGHK